MSESDIVCAYTVYVVVFLVRSMQPEKSSAKLKGMYNMKKKLISALTAILLCMNLILPASAANVTGGTQSKLDEVNQVYNDPDSTMCDIIRVTNPEAYAAMTVAQRADFANIRYQDVKSQRGIQPASNQYWFYNIIPAISNPKNGTLKYGCSFFSLITPGTYSADCSFIGLTCAVVDTSNGNKRIAFESESDYDTDEVDLTSTVSITSGHTYENECEAYGYDPMGVPFVIYDSISMTAY